MNIAIVLPSRGRPNKLKEMWDSAYNTASQKDKLILCVYVDLDDKITEFMMKKIAVAYPNSSIRWKVGPRILQSDMCNQLYPMLSDASLFQFGADDIIFETPGWDNILRDEFAKYPDGILFAYGSDGFQPETFGTHGCVSTSWYKALGYLTPGIFANSYADTWQNEISEAVGRKKFLPYHTNHMHYSAKKAAFDLTYQQGKEACDKQNSGQLYYSLAAERQKDVEKLKKFIEEYNG